MAGAEEFQRFSPRVRDDMYLPDEHMTQDLLASGTRTKLDELHRQGQIQADAARAPMDAAVNAYESFNKGRDRRLATEEGQQRLRQGEQSMKGEAQRQELTGVQLDRAKAQSAEENANRQFMDAEGTPGGGSRRQQLQQAEFQGKVDEPGFRRDEHKAHMAEVERSMKQMDMQIAQLGMAAQDRHEMKERQDLQDGFTGIYGNHSLTPEQQEQQAEALTQQHAGGKVPPQVVGAYRVAGRNGAAAAQAQGALNSQILLQGTEPYQHMAHATGSAKSDAQTIQQLGELRNQYNNSLRFGIGRGTPGDESDVSSQAREDFAKSLDNMQKHDLAEHVRSAGVTSVGSRMDDVIKTLSGQTTAAWQHEKAAIHPTMAQRPEVQQADQMIGALSHVASGETAKNQVELAPGAGQTTGSAGNAGFLKALAPPPGPAQQANNQQMQGSTAPQQPGLGVFMPPGGSPPAPAAGPGSSMPPGGMPPPNPYPYDFSKYRVNPQQPATGVASR